MFYLWSVKDTQQFRLIYDNMGRMMDNMCKEAVMVRFEILSPHLLESTEKYQKNTQTRQPVTGLRSKHSLPYTNQDYNPLKCEIWSWSTVSVQTLQSKMIIALFLSRVHEVNTHIGGKSPASPCIPSKHI